MNHDGPVLEFEKPVYELEKRIEEMYKTLNIPKIFEQFRTF